MPCSPSRAASRVFDIPGRRDCGRKRTSITRRTPGGAQLGDQGLGQQALVADRPQARHAGSFARHGRIPRHGLPPTRPLRPARLDPHARHHDHRRPRRLRLGRRASTSTARAARSTWPSTPGSTSSTPPTSTRPACRRRSSARRWSAAATACCWRPRRGCRWGRGPTTPGSRATTSSRRCEASLRRLRTDHIDLYQVHEWDGQTPLEETLDTLDSARARGQGALRRLLELRGLAARQGARDLRPPAPAALRQPADLLLAAGARGRVRAGAGRARPGRWGSSCGARWPAACCRASTAATPSREEGRQLTDWDEPPVRDQEQLYDIVDVLVEIAEAHGVSAAQVALAYTLGKPGRDVAGHRRAQGGAAGRQPRGGRPRARRRRARAARRGQRAAAALSLLAPGQDRVGPPERRRPDAARAARCALDVRRAALRRARPSGPSWAG